MQFHDRARELLEGIENRNRRKRVSGWIDDDAAAEINGLVDPIDQLRFTVRLTKLDWPIASFFSASLFDLGQRHFAVDLRLSPAQAIQVGTIQDVDGFGSCHDSYWPYAGLPNPCNP